MTAWQLEKLSQYNGPTGPVVTCVMDGVSLDKQDEGRLSSCSPSHWLTSRAEAFWCGARQLIIELTMPAKC